MPNYIYIEKVPLYKTTIGSLLFVLGFLAAIFINKQNGFSYFFIYLLLAYWGIFFISTEGLEIDFQKNKFRKLYSFYGIKIRLKWKLFPEIKCISLVETIVKHAIEKGGAGNRIRSTINEKTIKINIVDNEDNYLTIYFANDQKEAYKIASKIKEAYKIEITTNF